MKRIYYWAFAFVFYCFNASAQITLTQFATGLAVPVAIEHCGDDRLFIVEQSGRIQILDSNGVKNTTPFLTITDRVKYGGEQGLLGVAFPPDFLTSGYFYVDYTSQPSGATRISRFRVSPLNPDTADRASEEILLTIYQPYSNHNGGHVSFGPDGYLYIGMGDGGSGGDPGNRAQNPDSLLGKILRLAVDPTIPGYSIPPTNVFAGDTSLGRPEIYTLGMRNPWKYSFDRLTGDLWIADVGQNVYEEIDFQPAGTASGLNYGWRCYEANTAYSTGGCLPQSSYVAPVYNYAHTGGACSISGGYVYRGAKYSDMYGRYFYADYCVSTIQMLSKNGTTYTNANLGTLGGAASIVSFGEDKWGEMYCSGINSGIIYKFSSTICAPVAAINGGTKDTITDCGTGSVWLTLPASNSASYSWTADGVLLAADSNAIEATSEANYVVTVTNLGCTNTDSIFVRQISPLNLTVAGLDTLYCIYNNTVNLLPNYPGGQFSGPGINGNTFNPALAGEGSHIVVYTYTDQTGCTYSTSKDVRVDLCSGIERPAFDKLKLFPSPGNGDFTISGDFVLGKKISIEITNEVGKIVLQKFVVVSGDDIPVYTTLSSGLYFVKVKAEGRNSVLKLLVQ